MTKTKNFMFINLDFIKDLVIGRTNGMPSQRTCRDAVIQDVLGDQCFTTTGGIPSTSAR